MTEHPGGRYGELCEMVAAMTDSKMTALIVLGGLNGSGFSLAGEKDPVLRTILSRVLREAANEIDAGHVAGPLAD